MSRKHFNAIAKAFAASRPVDESSSDYRQWENDVREVTNAISDFNVNFDYPRFIDACRTW